jgi:hypothetical protein
VNRTVAATLITLAITAYDAPAQSRPDFSGSWKMNAARSDFGLVPPAVSIERKITHAEPSLTIVEGQDTGSGVQMVTRTYTTDGKKSTFMSQGAELIGTAVWEGNELVVTSEVAEAMLKYVDRMSLSTDGRTLTSVVKLATPQGDIDMKVVFEKQ